MDELSETIMLTDNQSTAGSSILAYNTKTCEGTLLYYFADKYS